LGHRLSRFWRQDYSKGAQDLRRIVSNGGRRVTPAQIYDRTLWPSDPQSGSRDRPKGICRETGRTRSRCGKERLSHRMLADRVDDLLESFIARHVSQNRSAPDISRMLRREIGSAWGSRSIHEITKRDVIDIVSAIEQRGAPVAANKALKAIKTLLPLEHRSCGAGPLTRRRRAASGKTGGAGSGVER
jgi:hypothetical protein